MSVNAQVRTFAVCKGGFCVHTFCLVALQSRYAQLHLFLHDWFRVRYLTILVGYLTIHFGYRIGCSDE